MWPTQTENKFSMLLSVLDPEYQISSKFDQ